MTPSQIWSGREGDEAAEAARPLTKKKEGFGGLDILGGTLGMGVRQMVTARREAGGLQFEKPPCDQ